MITMTLACSKFICAHNIYIHDLENCIWFALTNIELILTNIELKLAFSIAFISCLFLFSEKMKTVTSHIWQFICLTDLFFCSGLWKRWILFIFYFYFEHPLEMGEISLNTALRYPRSNSGVYIDRQLVHRMCQPKEQWILLMKSCFVERFQNPFEKHLSKCPILKNIGKFVLNSIFFVSCFLKIHWIKTKNENTKLRMKF